MSVPSIRLAEENWKSGKENDSCRPHKVLVKVFVQAGAAFSSTTDEKASRLRHQLRHNISKLPPLPSSMRAEKATKRDV